MRRASCGSESAPRDGRAEFKIVHFVDDRGHTLELEGINFGYDGGTPEQLLAMLKREGFDNTAYLRDVILNSAGTRIYPQTITRD